jgi:2-dehydro-3-deoxyphosphogluconate aldolase / (4S)-4-hydroxy-2-oxoglutarate aldolase
MNPNLDRIDQILRAAPVLPVLSIANLDDAVQLAEALVSNGLPVLEITLRTPVAIDAIEAIARALPDAIVGAGTIRSGGEIHRVANAGASFAISPGATAKLYAEADGSSVPWIPAIATASEIMQGLEWGHQRFKFFPATAAGGIPALNGFAGPFAQVKFCPTGGVDADTAPKFLALPNVLTVGGSWMVPSALLKARDFAAIGALARTASQLKP